MRLRSDRVDAARVISRDLTEHVRASDALREAQMELAHVARVTTRGEVTASIAHEVNQPLAAVVTSGNACRCSIVEAHGGHLGVAPNDGPGVTMHVALPTAAGRDVTAPAARALP